VKWQGTDQMLGVFQSRLPNIAKRRAKHLLTRLQIVLEIALVKVTLLVQYSLGHAGRESSR
jgi:hypothetical protein